jgi:hypothetical protein
MKKIICVAAVGAALWGCQKQPSQPVQDKSAASKVETQATPQAASLANKTYDGPFGLTGQLSVAELERLGFKAVAHAPGIYIGTPPKPLQGADSYAVFATPKEGTCRIRARVPVAVVNGSGDQLKAETDRLAEAMQLKYGKYTEKVDYIKQDVYRRNPEFWMMGLKEESVLYAYDWSAGKTEKPLPDSLENIEISADTSALHSGYVSVQYTYKNFEACHKESQTRKADNL